MDKIATLNRAHITHVIIDLDLSAEWILSHEFMYISFYRHILISSSAWLPRADIIAECASVGCRLPLLAHDTFHVVIQRLLLMQLLPQTHQLTQSRPTAYFL